MTLSYSNFNFPSLVLPPFTSTGCNDDDYSTIDYVLNGDYEQLGASVSKAEYPAVLNFNPPTDMSRSNHVIHIKAKYQGEDVSNLNIYINYEAEC